MATTYEQVEQAFRDLQVRAYQGVLSEDDLRAALQVVDEYALNEYRSGYIQGLRNQ